MFKIYDGREHFWQWDLNQKLIVEDPTVNEVHFCNRADRDSLPIEVYEENGLRLANVPNILLQEDLKIKVYAYSVDHTKHEAWFYVTTKSKPADYVYTETEVKRWEDLEQDIAEVVKSLNKYQEKPKNLTAINPGNPIKVWELETGIYRLNGYMYVDAENGKEKNTLNFNSNSYLIVNKRYIGSKRYYNWFVLGEYTSHYKEGFVPITCGSFLLETNGALTSNRWYIQGEAIIQDIESNARESHRYPSAKAVYDYVNTVIGGIENGSY